MEILNDYEQSSVLGGGYLRVDNGFTSIMMKKMYCNTLNGLRISDANDAAY